MNAGLGNFLHGLPAFERFGDRPLEILVNNLQLQEFADGEQLVTQGEQGQAVYILVSGGVRITRADTIEGADQDSAEARDGEVFGLLSLVDHMPSQETCVAHGRVTVAALTPERFHSLFLLAPGVARQLQYMVAVQLARDLQATNKGLRKGLALQKKRPSLLQRLLGASD